MILVTEFMAESSISRMREEFPVHYDSSLSDSPSSIPDLLAEAKALIVRNRTKVTRDLLASAPELLCVGRLGVGLDNIDLPACEERSISVYPATGANDLSVAEYVIASSLTLLRGAYGIRSAMLSGEWPREACASGRELSGKTMGLIGFGSIARQTASHATALGMKVCACDPFVPNDSPVWKNTQPLSFNDLLRTSDIVSLHVPLNDSTRHLIDSESLARMKPNAILVNAARGGVVDDYALAQALRFGEIAGAALDVFETEPLTQENAEKFIGLQNLILTPHIAGVTAESNSRVSDKIADLVLAHLKGALPL